MTDKSTPGQDFLFWTKAALPWAVLHFGIVFTIAYVTNRNVAAVGAATWIVVMVSGAVHYNRGKKDGLRESEEKQEA